MGHSEMECSQPILRDEQGKLPYDAQLCAPEEKRRRVQSFGSAAAESYGNGSSSARPSKSAQSRSGDRRSSLGEEGSKNSNSGQVEETGDAEV